MCMDFLEMVMPGFRINLNNRNECQFRLAKTKRINNLNRRTLNINICINFLELPQCIPIMTEPQPPNPKHKPIQFHNILSKTVTIAVLDCQNGRIGIIFGLVVLHAGQQFYGFGQGEGDLSPLEVCEAYPTQVLL